MATEPANRIGSAITDWHAVIGELFDRHQEQVVLHQPDPAGITYGQFLAQLTAHIDLEEQLLFPLHESRQTVRWATDLYRKEHRKIETLAAAAGERLADIPPPGRAYARWAIALLDRQRTLKHVLEHHEQREEQALLIEIAAADRTHLEQAADVCEAALVNARRLLQGAPAL